MKSIKGHSVRSLKLGLRFQFPVFISDLLFFSNFILIIATALQLNLFFFKPFIWVFFVLSAISTYLCLYIFKWSPTGFFLDLKKQNRLFGRLYLKPGKKINFSKITVTLFFTLLLFAFSVFTVIKTNPVFKSADLLSKEALEKTTNTQNEIPFFYLIAPWPSKFLNTDIFYQLQYNKGSPEQFLAKFTSIWSNPDIKVIFEGPKTPIPNLSPERASHCFWDSLQHNVLNDSICEDLRSQLILKPIKDFNLNWIQGHQLSWIKLPFSQGLLWEFVAQNSLWRRFTFFLDNGTTQTVSLITSNKLEAQNETKSAHQLFNSILSQAKPYLDLPTSRAWTSKLLSQTQLSGKKSEDIESNVISKTQQLLISKISIEPSSLESYFHFAGVSLMLLRRQNSPDENLPGRIIFKSSIEAASSFAKDIAKKSGEKNLATQIEQMVLESKKY